jgi:hypothetical protein
MKTKHFNPRNTGHTGKKRTKAFCIAQSKRFLGKKKSAKTRALMKVAAAGRWADPKYRAKHSKIMKKRWGAVHEAEKLLREKGILK